MFAGDYTAYYPKEESFFSHNEREFLRLAVKDIAPTSLASVPAVIEAPEGVKIAIAESDVEDYPGLWLVGQSGKGLSATFPPYPLQEELTGDRDFKVVKAADYIAVTKGTRTYPWRILGIAEKDGDLLTSPLVYLLEPSLGACRHLVDPAGQGGLGLVEREQRERRALQVGGQHRHLQVLHRFRLPLRARVRGAGRGLVPAG